jgi:hypothetical protein
MSLQENGERDMPQALIDWLREQTERALTRPQAPPWPHRSEQSFVLANGRSYASARLSPQELRCVRGIASKHRLHYGPFHPQQCFVNAQRAVLLDSTRQLLYVEGFVFDERSQVPFLHGWLVLGGRVVDFTAVPSAARPAEDEPLPCILGEFERRHYFGVEFDRSHVERRAATLGGLGALIDDWEHGFPLLRTTNSDCSDWRQA